MMMSFCSQMHLYRSFISASGILDLEEGFESAGGKGVPADASGLWITLLAAWCSSQRLSSQTEESATDLLEPEVVMERAMLLSSWMSPSEECRRGSMTFFVVLTGTTGVSAPPPPPPTALRRSEKDWLSSDWLESAAAWFLLTPPLVLFCCLRLAASVGSLYRNMLVLPRTTTQPCESLVGPGAEAALTMQRAPSVAGTRVATPFFRLMTQWLGSMQGPRRAMSGFVSSVPITVSPSLRQ